MAVSFVVHANSVRMRGITHHQEPSTERGIMQDNNEEEEDMIPDFAANYGAFFEDTAMGEPEEDIEGHIVEDDLVQVLREAEEVCEIEKESRDLKHMLEDYKTLLYPDCK